MRRSYQQELNTLPAAYAAARAVSQHVLIDLRDHLVGQPAIFVGAGGAYAVAQLGAELHEHYCGMMARPVTPLGFAGASNTTDASVVLLSAGARHPDTAAAAAAAVSAGARHILLITQRPRSELEGVLADARVRHVLLPEPHGRDGFLATRSLLAMATLLTRVYAGNDAAPPSLPAFGLAPVRADRRRVLVLTGPGLYGVGYDIEVRFAETGLADVEVTDYRNFAHGRHQGLARRLEETTVIALITPELAVLADRTLAILPSDTDIVRVETSLTWPAAALDLLARTATVVCGLAAREGLEPAGPPVPAFGRRLYHMRATHLLPAANDDPVQRKLREAIASGPAREVHKGYDKSLTAWLEQIGSVTFGGLVLDYDGTVCATEERFELPRPEIQAELLRLLGVGALVGFASGRGRSLYRDLRQWIPGDFHKQIYLGLYNGGLRFTLADDEPELESGPPAVMAEALDRILGSELGHLLEVDARPRQLTLRHREGVALSPVSLADLSVAVLARAPRLAVTVVTSGHSVDIVPVEASKASVLEDARRVVGSREILVIGDQGQRGGNDFALLAHTAFSLSVDRCSADPSRCWNLVTADRRGPDALSEYLAALRPRREGGLRFRWGRIHEGRAS
jgi:fructoselysine-6-P-deglycase FrlB-like protein/hydroxymethylpyrimidine pyrophosphatase-like HAD family hydrolase